MVGTYPCVSPNSCGTDGDIGEGASFGQHVKPFGVTLPGFFERNIEPDFDESRRQRSRPLPEHTPIGGRRHDDHEALVCGLHDLLRRDIAQTDICT
jgi:hypothetical protein